MRAGQFGKNGRVLEGATDRIDLALQPETYQGAEEQGWFYPRRLFVSGYAATLKVDVHDLATGATGSVSVPVHSFSAKSIK